MLFENRNLNTPRFVKYVIFAFVSVTIILLLMNTGVSKNIWLQIGGQADEFHVHHKQTLLTEESLTMSMEVKMLAMENKKEFASLTTEESRNESDLITNELNISDAFGDDIPQCFRKTAVDKIQLQTEKPISRSEMKFQKLVGEDSLTHLRILFLFNKILAALEVKAVIIEPSVIHCMLQSKYQDLLLKRNFSMEDFSGSKGIITLGVIGNDADVLQKENSILKFRRLGLQPQFVRVPFTSWMMENRSKSGTETYISHVFYLYYEWTIHVVVFQNRSSFLWHAAYDSGAIPNVPPKKDLLFVDYDSAYEKFSFLPLDLKGPNLTNIFMPSNPQHFLFQIPNSRFLECNLSRAAHVNDSKDTSSHSYLSVKKFNENTLASLKELKKIFNPLLMHFWIFSGTMLGWYRQCDVIPYTSDVDFGAWVSEIDDLDYIIKYFIDNKELTIVERMGVLEEALEFQLRYGDLRVDVFFMYKINNGSWASGHRPSRGYYFRYYYPHFSLCSAELLGEKVQVPCETEDVIVTEYGPNWMTPVTSWYYESSIHNRGPDIHWDEKRREKAFQEY